MEICPLVSEEMIFEGFLPYMGMAAILVMWPRLSIYTLVPPSYRCFTQNSALIGQVVSEKMFKYYGNIHVYCPGVGALKPLGPIFFSKSLIFSPTAHFLLFYCDRPVCSDLFCHKAESRTSADVS